MGKRILATFVLLAFFAPAGLATVSPRRLPSPVALDVLADNPLPVHPLRSGPVARLLVLLDHVLESVKPQENALAELLDVAAEKPEETREFDKRAGRHRESGGRGPSGVRG